MIFPLWTDFKSPSGVRAGAGAVAEARLCCSAQMTRRTLTSDLSRASERPTEPAPASGVETAGTDFGHWLTRDLLPKGAPSEIPVERPSQTQSVVIADAAEPELASWLLQDLKPRQSQP